MPVTATAPTRRRLTAALIAIATATCIATAADATAQPAGAPTQAQSGDALASQWYDVTDQAVIGSGIKEPVTQSRIWAVSWLAAARSVLAAQDPVAQQAGFAQALHDTLLAQVPAQQATLDDALATTLDALPSGQARSAGVSAGAAQASHVLAERSGDGLDVASVNAPWTPPAAAPGVWQPTAPTYGPAIRAGQGRARPFLLASNDQFDPGPPPSRTSATYLKSLAEVRAYGSVNSTSRTATQTDTALFWEPATNLAFVQLLRGVLANTTAPLSWDARLVASFHVVTADAQIAVYNAKYKYVAWRPETAIHADPANPDGSWTSFFAAPLHPEYPSGHAGYGGAAETVLTAFLGPDVPGSIGVTSATAPGSTHTWTTFRAITSEIVNARVWEGVHFRFSDSTGASVGRQVAGWDVSQLHRLGL